MFIPSLQGEYTSALQKTSLHVLITLEKVVPYNLKQPICTGKHTERMHASIFYTIHPIQHHMEPEAYPRGLGAQVAHT